jgi:hypothetical protein
MHGRWLTVLSLIFALLALLAMGALKQRRDYLTRGIPQDLPPPIPLGGVEPGINVYLQQYDDPALNATLQQIASSGIRAVKQPFYFAEPFDWAAADRLVAAVVAHDLQLVPLLDGDPERDFAPPEDVAVFAEWASAFRRRTACSHAGNRPAQPGRSPLPGTTVRGRSSGRL